MKRFEVSLLIFFITGCSHSQKLDTVVRFPYAEELLQKVQRSPSRFPSSVEKSQPQKSPRRVYFHTLYHQYLTLSRFLENGREVEFCPQFHHDKIEADSSLVSRVSLYKMSNVQGEVRNYFPELAFGGEFSLEDYHQLMRSEINVLCEDGISDNFFKFDNLITHHSGKTSFHTNSRAMISLLNIPVFANFYLLKMLESPDSHPPSRENRRFIGLTKTYWFENYVYEASRMRNNFIKNKMVKR